MFHQNNNQASRMVRQLQASEQQNARQLQSNNTGMGMSQMNSMGTSMSGQMPGTANFRQPAASQNQQRNNSFGKSAAANMSVSRGFTGGSPSQQMSSMSSFAGLGSMGGSAMGGQQSNTQSMSSGLGMGQQNTSPLSSGISMGQMNNSLMGTASPQNSAGSTNQRNQNPNISFGVGHLMNRR